MYKTPLTLFLLIISFQVRSQQNATLYQMHDIIQSNMLNPAIPAECGWILGFPALGNISISAISPLSYNDLEAGEKILDTEKILSRLKNTNLVSSNISINLFMLGYRKDRNYFQFTINERVHTSASINKDPIELAFRGNAPFIGETVEGNLAMRAIHYREFAFTYSREVSDNFWLGVRPKLLFGRLGGQSTTNKISMHTDPLTYDLTLASDLLLHASFPGTPRFNTDGYVDGFDTDFKADDFIINSANIGFGVDLGMSTLLDNGWKFSASVLNLGAINWKENGKKLDQKSKIVYEGPTSSITNWSDLRDTLKSITQLNYTEGTFSQMLSPVIMAGTSRPLNDYFRLGLTGILQPQTGASPWSLTVSSFTDNIKLISAGISYTVTNSSYVNLGFIAGLKLGAFNMHLSTDNILTALSPANGRYASVQFGINFRFGCGNGSDKRNEKPCAAYKNTPNYENVKSFSCKKTQAKK